MSGHDCWRCDGGKAVAAAVAGVCAEGNASDARLRARVITLERSWQRQEQRWQQNVIDGRSTVV